MTEKTMDIEQFELELLNLINSFLKSVGGKGPKQTEVRLMGDTIVYILRGILTKREKTLMVNTEGRKMGLDARRSFMELVKERRNTEFEQFLGCKIVESYESWSLDDDSAVAVLLLDRAIFKKI
ncbi:Na-translocating system protein MpsC family protein [Sporosarcina newyorkensis]|uniref:Na-translocating system protein MpsC family protein n=1 Tax=Sporosarcina newyorkensis TaxID=759851 RepID=UPI003D054B09